MTTLSRPFIALCSFILLFFSFCHVSVAGESEAQKAERFFQEGFILYQRHLSPEALQKFRKAAELGHIEAAYYAGEVIRIGHTFITPRSERWYRMAAEGGDVYAMLRLANADVCKFMMDCEIDKEEWLEKAIEQALPGAQTGDADAMNALYSVYMAKGDLDEAWEWLNKAASNGHSGAQYWLSYLIEKGYGFYWTETGRIEDAIHWMRSSAESGFPKAIDELARLLRKNGRLEEARYWLKEMAKTNYFTALFEYATSMIEGTESVYEFAKSDDVGGLAVLYALYRKTGSSDVEFTIKHFSKKKNFSPEVIQAAKARAAELLLDRPILYYDPKFGL